MKKYEQRPWNHNELGLVRNTLYDETNELILNTEEVPLTWFTNKVPDDDSWFGEVSYYNEYLAYWYNVAEKIIELYDWQGLHVTVSKMRQIVEDDRKLFLRK